MLTRVSAYFLPQENISFFCLHFIPNLSFYFASILMSHRLFCLVNLISKRCFTICNTAFRHCVWIKTMCSTEANSSSRGSFVRMLLLTIVVKSAKHTYCQQLYSVASCSKHYSVLLQWTHRRWRAPTLCCTTSWRQNSVHSWKACYCFGTWSLLCPGVNLFSSSLCTLPFTKSQRAVLIIFLFSSKQWHGALAAAPHLACRPRL